MAQALQSTVPPAGQMQPPLLVTGDGLAHLEEAAFLFNCRDGLTPLNPAGFALLDKLPLLDREQLAAELTSDPASREIRIGGGATRHCWRITVIRLPDKSLLALVRDETLEREIRDAMVESRHRYRDFMELSGMLTWESGADGRLTFVSPRGGFGYSASELIYADASQLFDHQIDDASNPFTTTDHLRNIEMRMISKGGQTHTVLVSACPLRSVAGKFVGVRGIIQDITRWRDSEAGQQYAEWQFAAVTEAAAALHAGLSADGASARLAPIVQSVFGAEVVHVLRRSGGDSHGGWTVADESIACSAIGINPLRVAALIGEAGGGARRENAGDPGGNSGGVTVIAHEGWMVLAAPLTPQGADLLMIWRRADYGPWTPMHCALAAAVAPIIAIGLAHITAPSDGAAFGESMGAWTFRAQVTRSLRRAAFKGVAANLLVIAIDPKDRWAYPCNPAPKIIAALNEYARASDAVGLLSPNRIGVWLDDAAPGVVDARRAEFVATAEHVLGLLRTAPAPFQVMHCVLSAQPDDDMPAEDFLLRAATVMISPAQASIASND